MTNENDLRHEFELEMQGYTDYLKEEQQKENDIKLIYELQFEVSQLKERINYLERVQNIF